jgi:DNA-directed RNA polymerase subunit RPC12/RpoP
MATAVEEAGTPRPAGAPTVLPIPPSRLYLSCSTCSYGVSIARDEPARCPMCGSTTWLPERRP